MGAREGYPLMFTTEPEGRGNRYRRAGGVGGRSEVSNLRDRLDAQVMHNACTTRMLGGRVRAHGWTPHR